MALYWDISQVKDKDALREAVEGGYRLKGFADGIIMLTMVVGIGNITEANVDEFLLRLQMLSAAEGHDGYFQDGEKARNPSREELRMVIGLKTNVTFESKAKFDRRAARCLRDRLVREMTKEA